MKSVFLDLESLGDLSLTALENECDSLEYYQTSGPEEVQARIAGAELLIINKAKINKSHFENTPSLRLICVVATGTDVVDLEAAKEYGVAVCNCQAYGTASVVQHVFSLILALQTNLLSYHHAIRDGRWQKSTQFCFLDYPIAELQGKTLGIVGYGTLGKGVGKIAEAFGMKLLLARRPGGAPDERLPLTEILPLVDVLTLHCPLNDATRNIIDAQALKQMKPTATLINAGRGGLVDEEALLNSLINGEIGGAAVDVLTTEPPTHSNPLLDARLPNLIVTPHIAWASKEARETILLQTVENIQAFKQGAPTRQVA